MVSVLNLQRGVLPVIKHLPSRRNTALPGVVLLLPCPPRGLSGDQVMVVGFVNQFLYDWQDVVLSSCYVVGTLKASSQNWDSSRFPGTTPVLS